VALTMEGKFAGKGLRNIDEDDDMLSAMARELAERNLVEEAIAGGSVLIFGQRPGSLGRRRSRSRAAPEQASLFNLG